MRSIENNQIIIAHFCSKKKDLVVKLHDILLAL